MDCRDFQDALFAQFGQIGSAFASPKRIEIVDVLAQGERNVETLARETGLSVANTSRHLQILKAANLVISRRSGLQVIYRLADPLVLRAYQALQTLAAARIAEVDRLAHDYFEDADGDAPVPPEELLKRSQRRDTVVLDVRPPEEYAAGHIAGAVSVPLAELDRRAEELPDGKKIVAYCRGPYCVLAAEAVRKLRRRGFDARRMADGFPQWRDAGLPVEHTSA